MNMKNNRTAIGLAVGLVAAVATLALGYGGLGWSMMSVEEALFPAIVLGPYAALAGLLWWQRRHPRRAILLLAAMVVVTVFGAYGFGTACYRRHASELGRMAMDLSAMVVPAVQWMVTAVVAGLISGMSLHARYTRRKS
jgi:hypothetical protein